MARARRPARTLTPGRLSLHRDPRTGRWATAGRPERYEVIRDEAGRLRSMLPMAVGRERVKEARVAVRGRERGKLMDALSESNILSYHTTRGARRVMVMLTGRDRQEKAHRFKLDVDVRDVKNKGQWLAHEILRYLASHGYRFDSPKPTKYTRKYEPLKGVRLVFRVMF